MQKNPQENFLKKLQEQIEELEDITERLHEMREMDESHLIDYPDDKDKSRPS